MILMFVKIVGKYRPDGARCIAV